MPPKIADWIEGLTDLQGNIARAPLPPSKFHARRPTAMRDGWIESKGSELVEVIRPERILDGFVALHDAPDDRVFRFASRWGMLGLCAEHLHPGHAGHTARAGFVLSRRDREPILAWRRVSAACYGLLEIAGALHSGRASRPEAWASALWLEHAWGSVTEGFDPLGPLRFREDVLAGLASGERPDICKQTLVMVLETWVDAVGIRPVFTWSDGAPQVHLGPRFSGEGPLGAIGVELLGAVAMSIRHGFCDACGVELKRLPRRGQRMFCGSPDCLKKARRTWAAEHRERVRREAALRPARVPRRRKPDGKSSR